MKISVITINYNNAIGLGRTLESVEMQTKKDFELVIVDGGSDDNSKAVIECFVARHPDVKWVSEPDKGIYNAMNKGVNLCSGDYCIFMNSGDTFYANDVIEECEDFLDGTADIVVGAAKVGSHIITAPKEEKLSLSFLIKESICHQSAFIKRSILLKTPYNERRKIVGDAEFFAKTLIIDGVDYKDISICVSKYEDAGASGNIKDSFDERLIAIKELLPQRMNYDVDFIYKYHNLLVLNIGSLFYNVFFRKLNRIIRARRSS